MIIKQVTIVIHEKMIVKTATTKDKIPFSVMYCFISFFILSNFKLFTNIYFVFYISIVCTFLFSSPAFFLRKFLN